MITLIMHLINGGWSYGAGAIDFLIGIILFIILIAASGEAEGGMVYGELALIAGFWYCLYKSVFSLTLILTDSIKDLLGLIGLVILFEIALLIPTGIIWYNLVLQHFELITIGTGGWVITIITAVVVLGLEVFSIVVSRKDANNNNNMSYRR